MFAEFEKPKIRIEIKETNKHNLLWSNLSQNQLQFKYNQGFEFRIIAYLNREPKAEILSLAGMKCQIYFWFGWEREREREKESRFHLLSAASIL